jgi:ribonuclease BN (tRNA processing enzyme)
MGAKMNFHDLLEGQAVSLDDGNAPKISISGARGNHPNGVWAYRVEFGGKAFVYATDTEHYPDRIDPALLALAKDVDVLVYDAQYTPEEYKGTSGTGGPKIGWGHSTYTEAAKLARAAKVKKLLLFHHDPLQSDGQVREKERKTRELFPNSAAAYEGLVIDL